MVNLYDKYEKSCGKNISNMKWMLDEWRMLSWLKASNEDYVHWHDNNIISYSRIGQLDTGPSNMLPLSHTQKINWRKICFLYCFRYGCAVLFAGFTRIVYVTIFYNVNTFLKDKNWRRKYSRFFCRSDKKYPNMKDMH